MDEDVVRTDLEVLDNGSALAPSRLTREAVLAATRRFDEAGSLEAYLALFQDLGTPQTYWLLIDGRRYPSKAIVHDALGLKARVHGGTQCRQMLGQLGFLVLNFREYEVLRGNFLRRMQPFTTFDERSGPYWSIEREYKEVSIDEVRAIASSDVSDAEAGLAILRKLSIGRQGLPLNWMAFDTLAKAEPAVRDPALAAIGKLARTTASGAEAMLDASRTLEAARAAGVGQLSIGNVLGIVCSVLGSVRPNEASWFKITKLREAGQRLFDRKLFPSPQVRPDDFTDYASLMRALFELLAREEDWRPIDLFDVQGFLWVGLCTPEEWRETPEAPAFDTNGPVYIVTARHGEEDGFERFITNRNWSLLADTESRFNRLVREMAVGDTIVMRDYFHQVRELPFDANGKPVSAMRLRAIGTVVGNPGDGLGVDVDWRPLPEPRVWYFYTNQDPVWRLRDAGASAYSEALRRFIGGEAQNYTYFLSETGWRERLFGSGRQDQVTQDEETFAEAAPMSKPENLILYGPPGTGKTFRTAREAVRLCGEAVPDDRTALMKRYNELRVDGRIEFVTFHQNFSYEEFIEGLRPRPFSDEGPVGAGFQLIPEAGIFKRFVDCCKGPGAGAQRSEDIDLEGRRLFKMSLGEANNSAYDWVYRDSVRGGFALFGFGGCDWSDPRYASKDEILAKAQDMEPGEVLSAQTGVVKYTNIFRNELQPGDVLIVSKGNSTFRAIGIVEGGYEYHPHPKGEYVHRRKVRWLWHDEAGLPVATISDTNFTMGTIYQLGRQSPVNVAVLQRLVDAANPTAVSAASGPALPHVLIIDEINRANVSKVFGELITLIETDKRQGMVNALEVKLPYSGKPFSVPANLHIVGTMNTADRSITQLDTALRRRFRFEEIAPQPDLLDRTVSDVPLRRVLETINDRVEFLLDRDHRIGHAFFWDCESRADIDRAMRDKVIPLLQEYFFEDWGLLAAVLGETETSAREDRGAFLGNRVIKDPTGRGANDRVSWWVRSPDKGFDKNAYDRLIKGIGAGQGFVEDEEAEVDAGEQP